MDDKVIATEAALELIETLKQKYGDSLFFHQSGCCCECSTVNCFPPSELTIENSDEYLGDICGCPFYISKPQYHYWKHSQLIIDVINGNDSTLYIFAVSPSFTWRGSCFAV